MLPTSPIAWHDSRIDGLEELLRKYSMAKVKQQFLLRLRLHRPEGGTKIAIGACCLIISMALIMNNRVVARILPPDLQHHALVVSILIATFGTVTAAYAYSYVGGYRNNRALKVLNAKLEAIGPARWLECDDNEWALLDDAVHDRYGKNLYSLIAAKPAATSAIIHDYLLALANASPEQASRLAEATACRLLEAREEAVKKPPAPTNEG